MGSVESSWNVCRVSLRVMGETWKGWSGSGKWGDSGKRRFVLYDVGGLVNLIQIRS
jgi:hypothetical protein